MGQTNLENLMDLYSATWEAFPNLFKGLTNEEILNRMMAYTGLTETDLDVPLALQKIQNDLDLDAFYDELEAQGIEV